VSTNVIVNIASGGSIANIKDIEFRPIFGSSDFNRIKTRRKCRALSQKSPGFFKNFRQGSNTGKKHVQVLIGDSKLVNNDICRISRRMPLCSSSLPTWESRSSCKAGESKRYYRVFSSVKNKIPHNFLSV
jgi:hypothetical protein